MTNAEDCRADDVVWDKRGQREKGQSKEQQVNKALRTGSATVITEKKFGAGGNPAAKNPSSGAVLSARKLEDETEDFRLEAPTMEMRKLLQQERMKAGLTQAELAQMCNIKPAIIGDYENGRGIPNPMMLGRLERAIRAKNPAMALGTLTKAQKKGTSAT